MMVEKEGLLNFIKKVDTLKKRVFLLPNLLSSEIADEGVKIASALITYRSFKILKESGNNGISYIVAKDYSPRPHIAYIEYGTGEEGRGTYLGNLPSSWEYYYPSEYKTVNKNGDPGWYTRKPTDDEILTNDYSKIPIVTGQPSQGNMWNVAQTLRLNMSDVIAKILKGE